MLRLTQINIFPVKSLDGYSPAEAIVERRGLQYDRRWMITDTKGQFLTQRTEGKMALLRATIEDNTLIIREKENTENAISIPTDSEESHLPVTIWDDTVLGAKVSTTADEYLSDFLKKKVHLVKMPASTERRVDEKYNLGQDMVSFADGYPFLIIGEASMQALNERMTKALSIRRFRANFIFSGGKPFEEDDFKHFRIGAVDFVGVKPCARCVLTTRDPDSGTKGKEPLRTLQTFRQSGNKILFGQNVVWNDAQWTTEHSPLVRLGDLVSVVQQG